MRRRAFLGTLLAALPLPASPEAESGQSVTLRGKLVQKEGEDPAVAAAGGKFIRLEGDTSTTAVIRDHRLAGAEMEFIGHFKSPDRFVIGPIHTKSMFVIKDGKPLMISYWCDVCSIRTYAPGPCMCCQRETELDLKEKFDP